jgi:hypothetical protein
MLLDRSLGSAIRNLSHDMQLCGQTDTQTDREALK